MDASGLTIDLRGARHGTVPVLGTVHLAVKAGDTVAITGPSGVGKTTLLRIVAGLHDGYDGTIGGAAAARLSMVFQEPTLLPWRTALDNILITTRCDVATARGLMAAVGLEGREGAWPHTLSLGQQRRLSLARAFAVQPTLLLMDEPFVSLDRETADGMMSEFEALKARFPVTTLIVTHDEGEASRLASRVVRLDGQPATIVA